MDLYYGAYYVSVIGSTVLSANNWHHIAGTYNGSQLQIYVDGVLDGTYNYSTTIGATTTSLMIGRGHSPYQPQWYNGLIDEVRVSNTVIYTSNFTPASSLTAGSSTKGLWKFDGQTPNDSSGNGNNGTLNGGATYSTDTPGGGSSVPNTHSLSVNGSTGYLEAPNSASLNITGTAITLEAWVKSPNPATGAYQTIVDKAPWNTTEGGYGLYLTNLGKARMDLYYGAYYVSVIGSTVLSANNWHHIAGTYNGAQLQIYLDGVLDGTYNYSTTIGATTTSLMIGRGHSPDKTQWYNGLIDEVRVSNTVLYTSAFTPASSLTAGSSTKGTVEVRW